MPDALCRCLRVATVTFTRGGKRVRLCARCAERAAPSLTRGHGYVREPLASRGPAGG